MAMGLDPRYVVAVSQQEVFTDKDTGEILVNGEIRFFKDTERQISKDVFVLTGSPDYTYTNIGSVVTTNSAGSPQYMGNNVNIYYFPYDEEGVIDRYFVRVVNANGTEQLTREAKPNVFSGSTSENSGDAFTNYIPNGQFLLRNNIENNGLITQPITDIALGGWTFQRPEGSDAIDNVTFTRFNSFTENPEAAPRYAVRVTNSGGGAGDLFKDLRVRFDDVNKFSSDDETYTIKFSARSLIAELEDINFVLIKNYGTGGDAETQTAIQNISLSTVFESYVVSFVFGGNQGKTLGTNDDDFLQLAIRLPTNIIFDSEFTNFELAKGDFSALDFPDTTSRQSISQSLGGAFPKPDPDGADLYLTPRLTPTGWEYDRTQIGQVIAKSTPAVEVGELLADGSSYLTNAKSADGIPYSRLQQKYFDDTTQTMVYGTGLDNMTAYTPGITGVASFMLVSNSSGVSSNADDGAVSTGFTFFDSHIATGNLTGLNSWAEAQGRSYSQAQKVGIVSEPIDVDSNVSFIVIDGTTETPIEFQTSYPNGATLDNGASPAKHWLFDTPEDTFYVWYQTNAETDPAVPGRTGIKVLVSTLDDAQQVSEKTISALCNYTTSSASTIDASLMTAGSYFTFSIPTEDFYIWYTIDGAGTDPAIASTTGIQVDLLNSDTADIVASKTQLAINTRKFAIPDYRGLFLRGATFDRNDIGLDDPALRFSRNNFKINSILAKVGSEELSRGRMHNHPALSTANSQITYSPVGASCLSSSVGHGSLTWQSNSNQRREVNLGLESTVTTNVDTTVNNAQNSESRPANSYVIYVIKY